ncbi:MAG: tRNA (guanosine(37)-N1)-methyltransferase TrmD, partial [Deltaproteobacteria bacterium CG12_big_fil_rev_8_21_14_0_65_43_10]
MVRFDILTLFPNMFSSPLNESVLKRAQEEKLIEIKVHDIRDFTSDK